MYNMESMKEGTFQTPISPGVFITVNKSEHDADGLFTNEMVDYYHVPEPDVLVAQKNSSLLAYEADSDVLLDLRPQYCRWLATCRSLFSPLLQVQPSMWVNDLANAIGNNPWRSFRTGAAIVLGTINTGGALLTIRAHFQTEGTQQRECNTVWTSGAIVRDSIQQQINSGYQFTDMTMNFCDHDGNCFSYLVTLMDVNEPREGNCAAI
jgi:hypothetical protein